MDQEIEVPSHFLCPISLQIMRDPVTVLTGITYDRDSIENWLFSCRNRTCPVTKQGLGELDITPNHTLRRLIQSWCTLNAGLGVERIPTPKPPVNESEVSKLIKSGELPNAQLKCMQRLKSIAAHGERNRKCLESAGTVEYLASVIRRNGSPSAVEAAVEVLFHLRSCEARLKSVVAGHGEVIDSLVAVMKSGSYQSRARAVVLLRSVLNLADPIQLMTVRPELFGEVISVLRDKVSPAASKAALKLLMELSPWGRNRVKAVDAGAVFVLVELLLDCAEPTSENKRTSELALTVLDQLCGCAEGRAELLCHGAGVAVVSKKILRVSHAASERAVKVLVSVCQFSGTGRVLQEMLQSGVVAKLCLVLQVDSSLKTKERAREILRLHSRVWKNSPCIPSHLLSSYPS